jgi:hypothetical protein
MRGIFASLCLLSADNYTVTCNTVIIIFYVQLAVTCAIVGDIISYFAPYINLLLTVYLFH